MNFVKLVYLMKNSWSGLNNTAPYAKDKEISDAINILCLKGAHGKISELFAFR